LFRSSTPPNFSQNNLTNHKYDLENESLFSSQPYACSSGGVAGKA